MYIFSIDITVYTHNLGIWYISHCRYWYILIKKIQLLHSAISLMFRTSVKMQTSRRKKPYNILDFDLEDRQNCYETSDRKRFKVANAANGIEKC